VSDFYNHESALKSQALSDELQKVAISAGCSFVDAANVAHAGEDGIHFSQEAHAALARVLIKEARALAEKEN